MTTGFAALCDDFYVNQRLNLKMDVPTRRDTVLSMFDRLRRQYPWLSRLRRYPNEFALESAAEAPGQAWIAIRRTSIRSGVVNPGETTDAYNLHRLVLETSPFFLDISPLDIDYVELLFGFDLVARVNHDRLVFEALIGSSPLAGLGAIDGAQPLDFQPLVGVTLNDACDLQAHFEVKTRTPARAVRAQEFVDEPISVYLTVRRYGPIEDVTALPTTMQELAERGEELVGSKLAPCLLTPLREAIGLSGM